MSFLVDRPTQLFYIGIFICCVNMQILKTQQDNLLVLPYFIWVYTLVFLKAHWFLLMLLYSFFFRCCKQLCQNWSEFNEEPLQQAMLCKVTVFLLLRGVLIVHCSLGGGARSPKKLTTFHPQMNLLKNIYVQTNKTIQIPVLKPIKSNLHYRPWTSNRTMRAEWQKGSIWQHHRLRNTVVVPVIAMHWFLTCVLYNMYDIEVNVNIQWRVNFCKYFLHDSVVSMQLMNLKSNCGLSIYSGKFHQFRNYS